LDGDDADDPFHRREVAVDARGLAHHTELAQALTGLRGRNGLGPGALRKAVLDFGERGRRQGGQRSASDQGSKTHLHSP